MAKKITPKRVYLDHASQFPDGRSVTAWIAAKGFPNGESSMGLVINSDTPGALAIEEGWGSPGPKSSQWRAYVQAVLSAVQAAAANSTLIVCTHHQTLVETIEEYSKDWDMAKRRAADEKWKAIFALREEKNIALHARLPDPDSEADATNLNRAEELAAEAAENLKKRGNG